MSEAEIKEALEFVRFNMACEGFELTEENISTGRRILSGEISGDEAVAEIIQAFEKDCHTTRRPGVSSAAGDLCDKM